VQAEVAAIMRDPAHPHHHGYSRGMPAASAYLDALYRRIPGSGDAIGGSDGITIGERGEPVRAMAPSDPAAAETEVATLRAQVTTALGERHGEGSGAELSLSQAGGAWLFGGAAGDAALDLLSERTLVGLAPEATVSAHVAMATFLADLERLRSEAKAEPASEGEAAAPFPERLDAALQKEFGAGAHGIRITINDTLTHLFAGPEGEAARATIERALDQLPPSARVKAYVASAKHLVSLSRLRQGQN
jgi:hypothetical protein